MNPTVAGLLAALQQCALLEPRQLSEVQSLAQAHTDPADLSRELTRRGWVTLYQLRELFLGRGNHLVMGPYVLLNLLGEGGMGKVYQARHRRLERLDALKVIRNEQLAQPEALQRFLREARAAARLNHPNIVTIYTTDEANGTHFIAMEFVAGVDLARIVREMGPLNAGLACDFIRQAALGLQHAHERGLVHRDIKPANLLVSVDARTLKILDMGLARLQAVDGSESHGALTQTGMVMGTPDYMAPEQAVDSSAVDIRADIYSLGCTLYYLLTGSPPFPQGSLTQKLLWHQQRDPEPLEKRRPDLPTGLIGIVRKMLAKNPTERFATPAEVALALEPFVALDLPAPQPELGGQTLAPGEVRELSNTDFSVSLARLSQSLQATDDNADFSFCQSSAGLVASLSQPQPLARAVPSTNGDATAVLPPSLPSPAPAPLKKRKKRRHRDTDEAGEPAAGINWYLVLGGVGFLIAAVVLFGPSLIALFTGSAPPRFERQIDHPGPVWSGAFLPDGKRVATCTERGVWLTDVASGATLRKLEQFPGNVLTLDCMPGEDRLLAGCVADLRGGAKTLRNWDLREKPDSIAYDSTGTIMTLAISPDGKQVAAAGGSKGDTSFPVGVWDVTSGVRRETFLGHQDVVIGVAYAPDSTRVASCSLDSTVAVWEPGKPEPVVKQKLEHRILALAFTPDGKELILAGENNTLGIYTLATKQWADASGFQGHTADVLCVAVSPDGKRLLSGSGDRTVRLWDIASRRQLAVLEGHTDLVKRVAFSPDGRRAISTSQDRTARLWQLP